MTYLKKKYQTDIISKNEMEKYLTDCGIENPLEIMKEAIKNKTSVYISALNAKLEWIYCGDKQWNFQGGNSDNLDDYNYQVMQ